MPDAVFDPSGLSAIIFQVKFKAAGDKKAESKMHPLGIPYDLHLPLPYLTLLMVLGSTSNYEDTHSKITSMTYKPLIGTFKARYSKFSAALKNLQLHQGQAGKKGAAATGQMTEQLKGKAKEVQVAMDLYNQYSISVCGASPEVYGILWKADIVSEFSILLNNTRPSQWSICSPLSN